MKNSLNKKINRLLKKEPDPAFARRARIILENLEAKAGDRVLDLGCGRGFYLKALACCWQKVGLYGVDLNQDYLEKAEEILEKRTVQLIKADAVDLPFSDNFFDWIIASEILEHIDNDQKAVSEIYRVLRPKGRVIITVPNENYPFFWDSINWILEKLFDTHIPSNIWWLAGIWAGHQRLYSKSELLNKLERAGFKIEKIWMTTYYCFPFSHFIFYGIGKNLLEKGFFPGFNRFSQRSGRTLLNKVLLWPIRKIDGLNKKISKSRERPSVNIIVKAKK